MCVIYPCSPLLQTHDLIEAASLLDEKGGYVVSTYPDRIQDAGCFYFGETELFRHGVPLTSVATTLFALPAERCIDINTMADLLEAERMFKRANP